VDRTAELRWFLRRPPPAGVTAWFEASGVPLQSRRDRYLVLAETDALGVKVRGGTGRLEFKLRPHPAEPVSFPAGLEGQREEWHRWSLPRPGLSRFLPRLGLPARGWRAVDKQRRTVTVPFRGDAGCRVEIAALRTDGPDWWTVGFEAFGPDADRTPALTAAVERFLAAVDLPDGLKADLSCGYPGWLATL